jgi:hypothetical protein
MIRAPVLVLVDDEKRVDLPHFVAEDVHDLVDKLCVVRVLEAGRVDHGDVGAGPQPPARAVRGHLGLGAEAVANLERELFPHLKYGDNLNEKKRVLRDFKPDADAIAYEEWHRVLETQP